MSLPARPLAPPDSGLAPGLAPGPVPGLAPGPRGSGRGARARIHARDLAEGGEPVECGACGSRAIASARAERCAFCGSSRLQPRDDHERIVAPASVLPFAVDRATATAAIRRFVVSRPLAPSELRTLDLGEPTAVLLPYWVFDALTVARYRGRRSHDHGATESPSDRDRRASRRPAHGASKARRARWRPVAGTVRLRLPSLLLSASCSVPPRLVDALPPLDLQARQPYRPQRLRGAVTERYALEPEDGLRIATSRVEREVREAVRRDIGGDGPRIHDLQIRHEDARFEQILRPVWLTAYRHRGRLYRVIVDARTGTVLGQRPWSGIRLAVAVGLVLALVLLVLLVGLGPLAS